MKPGFYTPLFALSLVFTSVAAATPAIEYRGTDNYVSGNPNFSRVWATGATSELAIPFDGGASLAPPANYSGPDYLGAMFARVTGTTDGTTPIALDTARRFARVTNSTTTGDALQIQVRTRALASGGEARFEAAAFYFFPAAAPFHLGDTSLRFTFGTHSHLSEFLWVIRDANGDYFISNIVYLLNQGGGRTHQSNSLTSRAWAPFDPATPNPNEGIGAYQLPADLGIDFTQITGAGVLFRYDSSWQNSGSRTLNAQVREFIASPHDPERDALNLDVYYFGNSLTGASWPAMHPDLGASAGKSWNAFAKLGAGWQIWQHRFDVYGGGTIDAGGNGDFTLDPTLAGDAGDQVRRFYNLPWDAMLLQPFGEVPWSDVVTERWNYTFPHPTDIGDPRSADDMIAAYLNFHPAGSVFIYPTWHGLPNGIVPPMEDWPEWTETYSKPERLIPGQTSNEFPDREGFVFDEEYLRFYQNEDPPWINRRNNTRDYRHLLFDYLVDQYPALWEEGRLSMIPINEIFLELDRIYRAGGDPELDNPAVEEKIPGISSFYADALHTRAGMPQYVIAASYYTAFYGEHPSALDWEIANDDAPYGDDANHDFLPILPMTQARVDQVNAVIWEVFAKHPYSRLRVHPFTAADALAPGVFSAWGDNTYGQVARDGLPAVLTTPVAVAESIDWFPGSGYAFAVRPDGEVLGSGRNRRGQLGDSTVVDRSFPWRAGVLPPTAAIAPASEHALARTTDGEVWAWGANDHGQLGDDFGRFGQTEGSGENQYPVPPQNARPRPVAGLPAPALAVAAGDGFSLALLEDGTVWAWGRNDLGQLGGTATADGNSTPAAVPGLSGVTAITSGGDFGVALLGDGSVRTWGGNAHGQLGRGISGGSAGVGTVGGLDGSPVTAVSAGQAHILALNAAGTVFAWGDNADGQLGQNPGITPAANEPLVVPLPGAAAVAAGRAHSLARLADHLLLAWGANNRGQLGDGTTESRWQPAPLATLRRADAIRAAGDQSAARAAPTQQASFDSWRERFFTPAEIAAGLAEPEVESPAGFPNLLYFATAHDPRSPTPPLFVTHGIGEGFWQVEGQLLKDPTGVDLVFQYSTNLTKWTPLPFENLEIIPQDAETDRFRIRFPLGQEEDTRAFVRLRASPQN